MPVGLDLACPGFANTDLVTLNYCTWPGVTCEPDTFNVISFSISGDAGSSYTSLLSLGTQMQWPLQLPAVYRAGAFNRLEELTVHRQLWGSVPESWGLLPGAMARLRSVTLDHAHNWLDGLPAGTLGLLFAIFVSVLVERRRPGELLWGSVPDGAAALCDAG